MLVLRFTRGQRPTGKPGNVCIRELPVAQTGLHLFDPANTGCGEMVHFERMLAVCKTIEQVRGLCCLVLTHHLIFTCN